MFDAQMFKYKLENVVWLVNHTPLTLEGVMLELWLSYVKIDREKLSHSVLQRILQAVTQNL